MEKNRTEPDLKALGIPGPDGAMLLSGDGDAGTYSSSGEVERMVSSGRLGVEELG